MRRNKDRWTQQKFAQLIDIDQAVISRLIARRVLTRDAPWYQWVRELFKYYANLTAGRGTNVEINLADERALLARAQTQEIQFRIKKQRGEFRSIQAISVGIVFVISSIRAKLLALPSRFQSTTPGVTPAQYEALDTLVREILTELNNLSVDPAVSQRMVEIDEKTFNEEIQLSTNGANGKTH